MFFSSLRSEKNTKNRFLSAEGAQMLIIMGFILAVAFITVTIMLGEVITTSNIASVESTDILKGDVFQAARAVKGQVDFARAEYNATSNQNDFERFMNNTTLAIQAMFASRGIAVAVDWSGVGFLDAIIRTQDYDRIAYCGRANASSLTIRNWLVQKGFNLTDYSYNGDCADRGTNASPTSVGKLFAELCKEGTNSTICGIAPGVAVSSIPNQTVAIFEFDGLSAESEVNVGIVAGKDWGCTAPGVYVLNESQCRTLQNWTNLGGKFIKTGSRTGFTTNVTVIDVLTGSTIAPTGFNGYSPGGANVNIRRDITVYSEGFVAPYPDFDGGGPPFGQGSLSPFIKNAPIGSVVRFSSPGYSFTPSTLPVTGVMAAGVCEMIATSPTICAWADPNAIVLNWTYRSGGACPTSGGCQVYYLPTLEGELRSSLGKKIIADPDDLRPMFNLTSPGGDCQVNVTVEDWRTRYNAKLLC